MKNLVTRIILTVMAIVCLLIGCEKAETMPEEVPDIVQQEIRASNRKSGG